MNRVLVTGGSGFVGRHALDRLAALGYEVHAVHRSSGHIDGAVTWHECDLLAQASGVDGLLARIRPSHLLHLAWFAEPGKFWNASSNLEWVQASLGLLRAFSEVGGKRAVVAGTCAEYDWSHGLCSEQITPCAPATFYGVCKNALREIALAFGKNEGIGIAWGRLFLLYGPHEHPSRLVSSVIRSLLHGELAQCTEGWQSRDFLHVVDAADALCMLLDGAVEGTVNICSGEPVRVRDMVELIATECGASHLVRLGGIPTRPDDPPFLVGDPARLRNEVGWAPHFDLPTGVADAVQWWRGRG